MPLWLKVALCLAFPSAVLFTGGKLMNRLVGRQPTLDLLQAQPCPDPSKVHCAERKPPAQRFGYSLDQFGTYLGLLEAHPKPLNKLTVEQRSLKVDLLFPFCYGGALCACLLWLWVLLDRPCSSGFVVAPVVLGMLSDWTENLAQLHEIHAYMQTGGAAGMQRGWVAAASTATAVKLLSLAAAYVLLLVLCAAALLKAGSHHGQGNRL